MGSYSSSASECLGDSAAHSGILPIPDHPNTSSPLIRPATLLLLLWPHPNTQNPIVHWQGAPPPISAFSFSFRLSHCLWKATRGCPAELFSGEAGVSSSREVQDRVLFGCIGFPEWPRAAQPSEARKASCPLLLWDARQEGCPHPKQKLAVPEYPLGAPTGLRQSSRWLEPHLLEQLWSY